MAPLKRKDVNKRAIAADKQGTKRSRDQENNANVEIISSKVYGDTFIPSALPHQEQLGPTSFAGLIPSSLGGEDARPARRVKTFQDVSASIRQHQHQQQQQQAAHPTVPLSQSDWLPPLMAPPRAHDSTLTAGPLQKHQPTATPQDLPSIVSKTFTSPPMDWSLKKSVRFVSSHPFRAIDALIHAKRRTVLHAERMFMSGAPWEAPQHEDDEDSLVHRLVMATSTFQFPQHSTTTTTTAAPAATATTSIKGPTTQNYLLAEYQEALCSLYDALCNHMCDVFYVVISLSKQQHPISVVFRGAGTGGRGRMHAIMGRSTAGIREYLKMHGIGYEAPLLPTQKQQNGGGSGGSGGSGGVLDNSTRSMLVFEGRLRVHALFDFLLNRGGGSGGGGVDPGTACDVPVLMAPRPFSHASYKRYHLTQVSGQGFYQVDVAVQRNSSTGSSTCAAIPPWVTDRLFSLFSSPCANTAAATKHSDGKTNEVTVSMYTDPTPSSIGLNYYHSNNNTKGDRNGEKTMRTEEEERWNRCTLHLDTNAIEKIVYTYTRANSEEEQRVYKVTQATTRLSPFPP